MHILLQMLSRRLFALQRRFSAARVPVLDLESTFTRQIDFEGVAPLSAGQGDVSAATIYFTSQKWRGFTHNHYRSGSSAPSAGCRACEVRGRRLWRAMVGLQPGERGWSSLAPLCVHGRLRLPCHEKWLLVWDGGGTRVVLNQKSLLASLGSPIPPVSAARASSCGLHHQIVQGTDDETFEVSFCLSWLGCSVPNAKCSFFPTSWGTH